jgi:hypothetical protein
MEHTATKSIVLPVYPNYLRELAHREAEFTCMIWGWQGTAKRMATPYRILAKEQGFLPFLFSSTKQEPKAVTHAAVSGLLLHREDIPPGDVAEWFSDMRIEHFALKDKQKVWGVEDARSYYVVTATHELDEPIHYDQLTLVSEGRPLQPNMRRGYAVVYLPKKLESWYQEACSRWNQIAGSLPSRYRR